MSENNNKRIIPDIAIHPGETLLEILDDANMTQKELAERIGVAVPTINDMVKGRNPVTPETAIKLERVFGISASFWNNLQKNYDETLAFIKDQRNVYEEAEIAKNYTCYNDLAKIGIVEKTRNWSEKARELMKFFQVASLRSVPNIEGLAFRKSPNKNVSSECLAMWLKLGELEASKLDLPGYDRKKLREFIPKFRELTLKEPQIYSKELQELCRQCGVALVYTPYVSNTYTNGAVRWLDSGNPLIQLSIRYRYADTLWFTFFHEVAHILNNGKKEQFVEIQGVESKDNDEKEADKFACEKLIPETAYKKFMEHKDIDRTSIMRFSKLMGISPDIVAGRVAHDTGMWSDMASLRKQLTLQKEK